VYRRIIRRGRVFYTVEFEYEFEYDNDIVWFATSIPYTYSMLLKYIKSIEDNVINGSKEDENQKSLLNFNPNNKQNKNKICEIKTLGKSLGGLNIPLIEITDFNWSKDELERRKLIILWGRVHPGETNASWITHRIIDYLLGNSKIARGLRNRVIFHIIPMINPDGVVLGNHRCSFLGRDINRSFEHPNSKLEPEPFCLRKHIKKIQKEAFQIGRLEKILAFIDIHAHSNRKSIFMYGPHYPLHSSNYMKIRVIPKLMSERTAMFRFYSCKFRTEQYKENCARLSLWRDFKIQTSLTIESSFHGYLDENRETRVFNESNLQYFGQTLCQSVFEYLLILEENKRQKLALAK
jgi:cytosolic carboxypeptidase protein 2/3